jgi:hypothetical protein
MGVEFTIDPENGLYDGLMVFMAAVGEVQAKDGPMVAIILVLWWIIIY